MNKLRSVWMITYETTGKSNIMGSDVLLGLTAEDAIDEFKAAHDQLLKSGLEDSEMKITKVERIATLTIDRKNQSDAEKRLESLGKLT